MSYTSYKRVKMATNGNEIALTIWIGKVKRTGASVVIFL